jgi:hypothetical protein
MQFPTIEQLNPCDYVLETKPFSQHWFRRKNGLNPKLGLCAALVQLWWASVREGKDGIELLVTANSLLVENIVNRQLRSYYFKETPNTAELNEEEAFWLNAKYGRTDLQEIRSLCEKYRASDLLELDLIFEHQAIIVAKQSSSRLTSDFLDAFTLPAEPGLRLLLLRHAHPGRRGGQSGHRMALSVSSDGGCKFFDPNRGEVTFKTLSGFRAWIADFWQICEYKARIEHPVADVPPLRLYRFGSHRPVNADLFVPAGTTMQPTDNVFFSSQKGVR